MDDDKLEKINHLLGESHDMAVAHGNHYRLKLIANNITEATKLINEDYRGSSTDETKECCQREKERDQFSTTCPECNARLPPPDGIKCWLNEDQRDRPWPPGAPAIGDRYIPYLTEEKEETK